MNDLSEGVDDDDGLPPHLRRLLDRGAEGPPMSAIAHDRVLAKVMTTVAVTATAATASAAMAASATSTPTATTTASSVRPSAANS